MLRVARSSIALMIVLACAGSFGDAHAAVNMEAVTPDGALVGFAYPLVLAAKDQPFTFVQSDAQAAHDMISAQLDPDGFCCQPLYGPDDAPWCDSFEAGTCPLFYSGAAVRGFAMQTLDLRNTEVGQTYYFACEIHPYMNGRLMVVSDGSSPQP